LGAYTPDATALDPGFITEDCSASQEHHEGGKATGARWPRSEVRHTRHALRRHGHHLWSTCVREPTGEISSCIAMTMVAALALWVPVAIASGIAAKILIRED
jgi:hypothetical protein